MSFYDGRRGQGRGFYGTRPGSHVGGLGLGPDLVVNGGFGTDTVWTKGTGWTIAAGVASFAATGSASNLSQDIGLVAGKVYQITFTVTVSAGGIAVYAGLAGGNQPAFATGTYTARLRAAGTALIYVQANATFTGSVDDISCRAIG